jgi:AAA domain
MVADTNVPGHPRPLRGRAALAAVPSPRPPGSERASWQRVVVDGLDARGLIDSVRGDHAEFHCPGPGHDGGDRKASGTADYDPGEGKTLICCHTGCNPEDVLSAVGCTLADLYDHPLERPVPDPAPKRCKHRWQPESRHPYPDADGQVVNTVLRQRCPHCGVKDTRPARPWPEPQRILYRLPEVLAAAAAGELIWVVEGEKCADALAAESGVPVTTNPFGAGKWLERYTASLAGASGVVIIADNDAAGYRHAAMVAASVEAAGITCAVARSATTGPKDDIVDHLAAGYRLGDLIDVDPAAELARIEGAPGPGAGDTDPGAERPRLELAPSVVVPAGQRIPVDPLQLPADISLLDARRYDPGDWPHIVPGLLPVGLAIVFGRPGVAKTTLSAQLEHCIAAGLPVAGYRPEAPGRCLVIDYEGGPALAINQSLRIAPFGALATDAAGDRDDMISVRTAWPGETFAERLAELEKALLDAAHEGRPYKLVRIDTMRAFQGGPPIPGMNAYQWDSECLIKVNKLARDMQCAIIVIHHPNKSGELSGSVGLDGSVTVVYKLERAAGESEGLLRCTKNRVGREVSFALEFDRDSGTWSFSDEITAAQAANTGVKRQIIDWLTGHGPAAGPEIRAGLGPGVRERTARDMMTRLAADGWITRAADGTWMLVPPPGQAPRDRPAAASAAAATESGPVVQEPGIPSPGPVPGPGPRPDHPARRAVGTCAACGTPMTILTEGQARHPLCEPDDAGPPAAPRDGSYVTAPFPAGPDEPPAPAPPAGGDAAGPWGEGGTCQACGEPVTSADTHPDCTQDGGQGDDPEVRWAGMSAMRDSIRTSRMKPIPWIPPLGDPRAKEGMQTRDLPQWQAAEQVSTGAFAWRHPGIDDLDGDALVITIDRNMSYPSACSSVPVAPNVLRRVHLAEDPKAAGLAGIARVIVPQWPDARLPHPLGRDAVPGEPLVIPSGSLEELWALHRDGLIDEPEVTGAFMGRRNTSLFEPFYKSVTGARREHASDPAMTLAIKRSSSIAVRLLYPKAAKSPYWRPDWYGALVGQAMIRHWIRARQAVDAGAVLIGLGSVDEAAYLIPAGTDPATWIPAPYEAGSGPGQVKRKRITVRRTASGLDGLDPAAILPSPRGGDWAEIGGPVPLRIWRQRHG